MTIAVTGGAGYIGAHVVHALVERGESVLVVDDLSAGERARVDGVPQHRIDVAGPGAAARLTALFRIEGVDAVIHLAARKAVGESVQRPLWYTRQNVTGTEQLLRAAVDAGVADVLFSSSAAVYGSPSEPGVTEETPTRPINPYGWTKLAGEWLAADVARAHGVRTTALRYFNVAGTRNAALADRGAFNLIPIVLRHVLAGTPVPIFGDDYDTTDGTCVRDYVHVIDIAEAHLVALDHLRRREPGTFDVLNVGTGSGASVREVLDVVARATGRRVRTVVSPRRPGDAAAVTANIDRIATELGWRSRFGLEEIVASAWEALLATR